MPVGGTVAWASIRSGLLSANAIGPARSYIVKLMAKV